MTLQDRVIVITGAANGIGRALALRFARESPAALILADIDEAGLRQIAADTGGAAVHTDVSREPNVVALVSYAMQRHGRIGLFCSNAGVLADGGEEVPDAEWDRLWSINVKAHIYAARAALPEMLKRGEGYLLNTVSAAGLLTGLGSAPYSVTKHAALAFAEWIAITYGARGIKVSCLCPQFVSTAMVLDAKEGPRKDWMLEGVIPAEKVADCVVEGLAAERFLILPHPEVAEYFRRKANDYDRWLGGMRKLLQRVEGGET